MNTILKRLIWRLRYAWRLHSHGGLGIIEALRWPVDWRTCLKLRAWGDIDPIEAADAEITYMREA